MRKATMTQYLQIGNMIDAGAIDRELAQAIIEGKVVVRTVADDKPVVPTSITVPDLSPAELVARAQREIDTTSLDDELVAWNFTEHRVEKDEPTRAINVRGKKYEVLTWALGGYRTTEQVREHFKGLNADGNTAAFIAWVTETKPRGFHVSIPSDDTLLWRNPKSGSLYAPCFGHDDAYRDLFLSGVRVGWSAFSVFVAFREIPSA